MSLSFDICIIIFVLYTLSFGIRGSPWMLVVSSMLMWGGPDWFVVDFTALVSSAVEHRQVTVRHTRVFCTFAFCESAFQMIYFSVLFKINRYSRTNVAPQGYKSSNRVFRVVLFMIPVESSRRNNRRRSPTEADGKIEQKSIDIRFRCTGVCVARTM